MGDKIDMSIELVEGEERLELSIGGDKENISLSGDIDLTLFVKKLTLLIPQEKLINFLSFESENPKINLVLDTLNDIVESFNESLKQEIVE